MKTSIRLLLCGLVAALAAAAARPAGPGGPATGKILVLDNDRTCEGDIERVGDRYRVCRGGITWVPAERVLQLCASKEEALAFLRRRANLADPDEHLRLARWCHLQGLRPQALAEVKAAVELRPEHDESRRLLAYLEQAARRRTEAVKAPTPPPTPLEKPALELSADAVSQFATQVQPILMNACARCHVASTGEVFRLQRAYEAGLTNRRATQQNLTAVLAQLNLRQPEYSKLLVKAVSAHGRTGEAPLRGRQAEAFKALEDWVRLTLSNNPQLQERLSSPLPVPPPVKASPAPVRTEVPVVPSATPAAAAPRPTAVTPPPTPPRKGPEDAYDPDAFNNQMHPDRPAP